MTTVVAFPDKAKAKGTASSGKHMPEMSHRVENLLQIATALTQITSRSAATKEEMAQKLTNRLSARGRAQDLVRKFTRHCHPCV